MQQHIAYIPVDTPWQGIAGEYLKTLSRERRKAIAEELGVHIATLERIKLGHPIGTRVDTIQRLVAMAAEEGALPRGLVLTAPGGGGLNQA